MGCTCSSEEQSMSQNVSSNRHYKSNRNNQRERDDRYPHQRRHNNNNNNQDCSDNNNIFQPNFEPFLQSRIDPYFNFPEVEGEVYVGEGLKKMKGYISQISKEEILKKREEFWQTRVEGNKDTWAFLQRICEDPEFEHEDIGAYLSATGIVPYKDCINVTYDTFGGLYEIPNYCIHFPSKYDLPEFHKEKPNEEKQIIFIIRKGMDNIKLKLSNFTKIKQVKIAVAKNFPNINVKSSKVRLFFGGKELEDDKEIWFYNIENDSIILLMIRT